MKTVNTLQKKLTEYKAVIFDLDGTLYYQSRMRRHMAFLLLHFYLFHPSKIKDLFILKTFRRVREHWDTIAPSDFSKWSLEQQQYLHVACLLKVPVKRVLRVVTHWILNPPLPLLVQCRDTMLGELICELESQSVMTAVYSDYPALHKAAALQMHTAYIFSSSDPEINCMKPDPKALHVILQAMQISPDEAALIGDRYEKDGAAAQNAGLDFLILPKSKSARNKLYQII